MTTQTQPLIQARGVTVRRDGRTLIEAIDLSIAPAEIVTLVGPNGGGKTTLLRTLIGAERPSAGRVIRAPNLRIGYMPQKLAIDRSMPIQVDGFLRLAGAGSAAERRAALERVGIAGLAGAQLTDLSGGETQRALLARALLRRPRLLLMDEPTQGLDHLGEASFYALVAELRENDRVAVLLVSHDLHMVMRASDRVICLNRHVCCHGTPTDVSSQPEYTRLFGPASAAALAAYPHRHDHTHE